MNICSNKFLKFWVEMPCLLKMKNSSILMKCLSKDIMVKRENEFLSQKDCTEALKIPKIRKQSQ